ncbi:MAG: Asp-tRNA(Asn)/Glu-tRNA(Gln) amidotransferase subunit GatA [Gemmatimonadaceae bacterium]
MSASGDAAARLMDDGAAAVAAAVRDGRVKGEDVFAAALGRVRDTHVPGDSLNAMLAPATPDAALEGRRAGALAGVPVAVKDNIATLTLPTGCASRILAGWVSPYEATVVSKLRDAGAVVVGKTNMDEFAMGSSTENSAYGPSLNPLDRTRVPGGSSGGSAVAVAAGIAPIALGSETGGSVRQPAAFCGIVGVKPTYGRVSRFGLVAFASSLDAVGTFGRTVDDAALATEIISGHDPLDSTSSVREVPSMQAGAGRLDGLVIGVPKEYFPESLPQEMRERCERALEALRSRGATTREVSLPHTSLAIPVYYIIAPAEASANLARFDGVRYGMRMDGEGVREMYEATRANGFGPEVTRRILLGTYVLSAGYYDAYYRKAQEVRALIARDFERVFADGVDLLFTPTTPSPAFKLGAISDPYEMYLSDIFTVTANLAGIPAMSLPIGRVDGLPVGGQLLADHFAEPVMFRAAYALEDALGMEAHK